MYGHGGILQQLLAAEMQLDQESSVHSKDVAGQTALHYAARWGYPQVRLIHSTKCNLWH